MPELPEVEVVRRGVAAHAVGRRIENAEIRGTRVARRHLPGPEDLAARLTGRSVVAVARRGKFLWLALDADEALVVHLGMSGQLLVADPERPDPAHLHARFVLDDGQELRFVDQRTFGGLALAGMDADGIPEPVRHIARDPFDPLFAPAEVAARMVRSSSGIKRLLLNQRLVSGIGNIYADEALWRARIHGERPGERLTRPAIVRLLGHARDVMAAALEQGGTSFDALYVNVNGQSGYFDRRLRAYGQEGRPCERCGTLIRREHFMNRSSHFCPRCQPVPRCGLPHSAHQG
ncbi:MAG: bifunctional DNA-formamidopyrimidine glycosylase/DNA-(apurinic or apyrimidinic site) lyase [Tetrasphaera sp.]